jgi:uncharacterized protein (TIGR03492 family)
MSQLKLLCLSNGHGEDAIALRILQALQQQEKGPQVAALPIVGVGHIYRQHDIPLVGPVKQMPSGGFIYMDRRQLLRDVQGGLLGLTWGQLKLVRQWAKKGGVILAVGDIVPLLFAWLSGAPYVFVGTAKSEYYLRDEAGPLPRPSWFDLLEGRWGSVYLPWERWMMAHRRCRGVFPRDRLTTQVLQQWPIPAFDLGNPMMDGLDPVGISLPLPAAEQDRPLTITLLPGSRSPEAYDNWRRIVEVMQVLTDRLWRRSLLFLGAIAPTLDVDELDAVLRTQGWRPHPHPSGRLYGQRKAKLLLTQTGFADCLHAGDLAIAMAGTATEQFVGLGKPALTLAGMGPQFTPTFAEAQTRLLGPSVTLLQDPQQALTVVEQLLNDPDRLQLVGDNGRRRMGTPGAAQRIASQIMSCFQVDRRERG